MSLDGLDHVPLCGSELGDQVVKAAAVKQAETNTQNSEFKPSEARGESKRGRLHSSPSTNDLGQPEHQKLFSAEEKAVLEAKYKEKVAENEQLRAAAYNLEYQLQDVHRDSAAKLSTSHCQVEEQQAVIERLSGDVRHLQDQREALQRKLAEDQRLKESLRDLEKEESALRKQIRGLTDKCSYFESLAEKQNDDNSNLKTSKRDLQRRISEAKRVISNQGEIMTRQQRDVSSTEEMKEELQSRARKMQETVHELHQQAEQRNEEDALAVVLKDELGDHGSLENPAADDPPAGVLKNVPWNRCARFLLAGVVTGLSTVGVLRSWDMMTLSVVTFYKNSAECLVDCVSRVMEPQDSYTENSFRIF